MGKELTAYDRWTGRVANVNALWPVLVPASATGVITAYLAHGSAWISQFGALGWWSAGLIGAFTMAATLYLGSLAYYTVMTGRRTAAILDRSGLNPLDDRFERAVIRLSDFYSPAHLTHENKDFRNCNITGPGLVYFSGSHFEGGRMRDVQICVAKAGSNMTGVTAFHKAKIVNCDITNLTMVMGKNDYNALPDAMKATVPVLNEIV
jgi:hypothetical protein